MFQVDQRELPTPLSIPGVSPPSDVFFVNGKQVNMGKPNNRKSQKQTIPDWGLLLGNKCGVPLFGMKRTP